MADKTTGGKTPKPLKGDGSVDKDKFKKCQYVIIEDGKEKKCKNEAIIHTKKQEHLCVEHYHLIYDAAMAARGKQKKNRLGAIKVTVGMIFPEKK